VKSDRRDIDTALGVLDGEAAQQKIRGSDEHFDKVAKKPWPLVPSVVESDATYYDRPVLKEAVWIWAVPLYFYVGGLSGASMVLGAAAQIAGGPSMERFVRHCRWIGGIGGGIGSVLLIVDLGRPARFLNMLRVFRPTSPMNMGAWVLAGAAPAAMGSAMLARQTGPFGLIGHTGGMVSGLLGLPLAGYTAVLLSNSAVPLWQGSRRSLPFLFVASAITSAASFFDMFDTALKLGTRERKLIGAFGTIGRVGELVTARVVERECKLRRVRKPFHEGGSGVLLKAATVLTTASLVLSLLPGGRKKRVVAGVFGTLGALALRYGIYYAGRASAQDPRATFHQQRFEQNTAKMF
jgi:formate-dependent nitrite reductase membrane component NrfD